MSHLYFKKSIVSVMTLALLLGASTPILAAKTPRNSSQDKGQEEDDKRKVTTPRKLEDENEKSSTTHNNNNNNSNNEPEETACEVDYLGLLPEELIVNSIAPYLNMTEAGRFDSTCVYNQQVIRKNKVWAQVRNEKPKFRTRTLLCNYPTYQERFTAFCKVKKNYTGDPIWADITFADDDVRDEVLHLAFHITSQFGGKAMKRHAAMRHDLIATLAKIGKGCSSLFTLTNKLFHPGITCGDITSLLSRVYDLGKDRESVVSAISACRLPDQEVLLSLFKEVQELGEDRIAICAAAQPLIEVSKLSPKYFLNLVKDLGSERKSIVDVALKNGLFLHDSSLSLTVRAEQVLPIVKELGEKRDLICSLAKPFIRKSWFFDVTKILQLILNQGDEAQEICTLTEHITKNMKHSDELAEAFMAVQSLGAKRTPIVLAASRYITADITTYDALRVLDSFSVLGDDFDQVMDLTNKYNLFHFPNEYVSLHLDNYFGALFNVVRSERESVCALTHQVVAEDSECSVVNDLILHIGNLGKDRASIVESAKKAGLIRLEAINADRFGFIEVLKEIGNLGAKRDALLAEVQDFIDKNDDYNDLASFIREIGQLGPNALSVVKIAKDNNLVRVDMILDDVSNVIYFIKSIDDNREGICKSAKEYVNSEMTADEVVKVLEDLEKKQSL